MKTYALIAVRKDEFGREIRDVLGFYSHPHEALLDSQNKKRFYPKAASLKFEINLFEIKDGDKTFAICINNIEFPVENIIVYGYPMDDITTARYTGRTISPIETIQYGKGVWEAIFKISKAIEEEKEKFNE